MTNAIWLAVAITNTFSAVTGVSCETERTPAGSCISNIVETVQVVTNDSVVTLPIGGWSPWVGTLNAYSLPDLHCDPHLVFKPVRVEREKIVVTTVKRVRTLRFMWDDLPCEIKRETVISTEEKKYRMKEEWEEVK